MAERFEHRGRGAISNQAGRYERHTHDPFDDGWGTIEDEAAPLETILMDDTAKTIITFNNSSGPWFRPDGQSLSRLRAWLHLLFRAAHPCLGRAVGGAGFREPAVPQDERAGAAAEGNLAARLCGKAHCDGYEHRRLPACGAQRAPDAASPRNPVGPQPSRQPADEIRPDPARHRPAGPDGGEGDRPRRRVDHDAGPHARPQDGAARRHARAAAGDGARAVGRRASRWR